MPSPHHNNLLDKPLPLASLFLAIDTETAPNFNKNNPQTEVIEIAAVLFDGKQGKVLDEFESLVKPTYPIPPAVERKLNITNTMVRNAPDITEIFKNSKFNLLVAKSNYIVGHNLAYDLRVLKESLTRRAASERLIYHKLFSAYTLDSLQLSKKILKNKLLTAGISKFRLKDIASFLDIEFNADKLHSAKYDALLTTKVFYRLIQILKQEYKVFTMRDLWKFLAKRQDVDQLEFKVE